MKKMITMIDPPSGWHYDFPKELPDGVEDIKSWLVENGYPQDEVDKCGDHFYWRIWQQESN